MPIFINNLPLRKFLFSFRIKVQKNFYKRSSFKMLSESIIESTDEKTEKFNTSVYRVKVQVLGSGAQGAARSVQIFCDDNVYLFNCGEGTQRNLGEARAKVTKMTNMFITYPSWENISGLFGLALIADSSGVAMTIKGHPIIKTLLNSSKGFVSLKNVKPILVDHDQVFSNGNIIIHPVHLYPTKHIKTKIKYSNKTSTEENFFSNQRENTMSNENKVQNLVEENLSDDNLSEYLGTPRKLMRLSAQAHSNETEKMDDMSEKFVTCYVCETSKTYGSLILERCLEEGITPGPLLGDLKKGIDVTLKNGKVVKSCDVKSPDYPGIFIIVLECPTEEYLDNLLQNPVLSKHQNNECNPTEIASLVIHFTPAHIIRNPKYQVWINCFPKQTKHLYINEDNKSLGVPTAYKQQYELNLLHSDIFPILKTSPSNEVESILNKGHTIVPFEEVKNIVEEESETVDVNYVNCNENNHIKGEAFVKVFLKPKTNCDYCFSSLKDPNVFAENILRNKLFVKKLEDMKNYLKENEDQILLDKREYPKILFLGTGSSAPNKRRNASGILIFINEKNLMLLDCAEGTYLQMLRFFGTEKTKEILRNLNLIYISHMHADHHMGLISILLARKLAFQDVALEGSSKINDLQPLLLKGSHNEFQPIYLLAPIDMIDWLTLCNDLVHKISDTYIFIDNSKFCTLPYSENFEKSKDLKNLENLEPINKCLETTNFKEILTATVQHCRNSYGISFTHKDGWKLTYSGDTRPCQALINIGLNSDLLIHEATMDHVLWKVAAIKQHSTTTQAIEVGKKMKAKFTLLTHFSQRYSHVPLIGEEFSKNVGVAYDNMLVSLNQLPLLPHLSSIFPYVYEKHYEKLKQRQQFYINRVANNAYKI